MGQIIRKNAAAEAIHADAATTLRRAEERGGVWREEAKGLGEIVTVAQWVGAELPGQKAALDPLAYQVVLADERADELVHEIHDEAYNLVGRPRADPLFTVLFAAGAGGLVNDDRPGQPTRMRLLAGLFESRIHPRIPEEAACRFASALRDKAGALEQALQAEQGPRAQYEQQTKTYRALATAAQVELSRFKRRLIGAGFSESDIHAVIPDRPRPVKKDASAAEADAA